MNRAKVCFSTSEQRRMVYPSASITLTALVSWAESGTRDVSLFVEGPTPDWALPIPRLLENSPPGMKRFVFELEGLPPGAKPDGAALKLTLTGGDRAYEFNVKLN